LLPHSFDAWRPGDQLVFISDIGKAESDFGWKPAISVSQGIDALLDWLVENRNLFDKETSGECLAEGAIAR
jgi:CDP-paratose 2-epimerase